MNNLLNQTNSSVEAEKQNQAETKTEAYQATQYLLRRIIPPEFYYQLRTWSRQYPFLFLPISRWRWSHWRKKYCADPNAPEPAAPEPLVKDTEIVIEAYPRCGNTFAHIAFKFAQQRKVKIGHHTHAAAQVIAAVKNKIPTIVLIRDPEDTIVSYLVGGFDPGLTIKQALREYISFYGSILPYRQGFVLATFEELKTDYGAVIRRVNQIYGTNFQEFEHTPANVSDCFSLIDAGYENAFGDLSAKVVSRPAPERIALQQELRQQFQAAQVEAVRTKAYQIYANLLEEQKPK
jgi:hypothetical protein